MNDHTGSHAQAETVRMFALLTTQANDLRKDLMKLQHELADVKRDVGSHRVVQLLEANEKLVLAVLNAETIAETATSNLSDLIRSSQHDALTQNANRALMFKQLTFAIARAHEEEKCFAVLFLDLDHFAHINNTHGHACGDEVLKLVGRRLERVLRDSDTVSRHGGDEFLILLADVSQINEATSIAASVAARVLSGIAAPCTVGEVMLHLSASIGIAMYPGDGDDVATLIDRADAAMFRSKRAGPGGFLFYNDAVTTPDIPPMTSLLQASVAAEETRFSDLREANEQLVMAVLSAQELEALAQEAHRQQIKFMAMVAHELRNPLTPIRVAASLLIDRNVDEEPSLARLQMIIDGQVTHMSRLISDLLDGSRISTGKLRLEYSSVEMVGILNTAIDMCRPGMDTRQQRLATHLPASPIDFYGDAVRLVQVISNLLDNASKYTPVGGQIALEMTLSDRVMTITVSDNGIGISAEALPHIFDLFVQDVGALIHASGGLGIGLAVVRDLVIAHGGTVAGYSAGRNLGSKFVLTLPWSDKTSASVGSINTAMLDHQT